MLRLEALALPVLLGLLSLAAAWKRLPAYDLFVEGCKAGLRTAVTVLPNLIAMMVALSLMQESGLMDALAGLTAPVFTALGLPPEVAPLAFLRPMSGAASLGLLEQLLQTYGPDGRVGLVASTIMGSSETIFYTVCVYLGAIRQKSAGFAVPCALLGMLAGVLLAGVLYR